jgi:hypothetical protein
MTIETQHELSSLSNRASPAGSEYAVIGHLRLGLKYAVIQYIKRRALLLSLFSTSISSVKSDVSSFELVY